MQMWLAHTYIEINIVQYSNLCCLMLLLNVRDLLNFCIHIKLVTDFCPENLVLCPRFCGSIIIVVGKSQISWPLVRERTIPTEQPLLVNEI
jgi:hypothetical protein